MDRWIGTGTEAEGEDGVGAYSEHLVRAQVALWAVRGQK